MKENEHQIDQEEQDLQFLEEWLPKISGECRAYIKGASQALLYAQEEVGVVARADAGEVGG